MPSIVYPITRAYRAQWGLFDGLRECIYQEYLDLFDDWTIEQADGRTVVEGRGAALDLRHLLLGASDKTEGQRGQFGEGTKLGWLVLLREGVPFTLTSGRFHGLHARWTELYGQQVMEVCWEEGPYFGGSRYELEYDGPIWQDRVVRPGDPRVLFTDDQGRMILAEDEPQLYVQGLWIGPARPNGARCCFGYSLPLELAEDRKIADTWQVSTEMGHAWETVADPKLLFRFWEAVAVGEGEQDVSMSYANVAAPEAHREALREVFGRRAVVATDAAVRQEAVERGLEPIIFRWGLSSTVAKLIGTDREELQQLHGQEACPVAPGRLNEAQRRVLSVLKRLARRVRSEQEVRPYTLPTNVLGQGMYAHIALDVSVLGDMEQAIAVWLREATRVEQEPTAAAVAQVAARVIASYAAR